MTGPCVTSARPVASPVWPTPRSSTRCSMAASTCRRRPTKPGSCPRPTMTRQWSGSRGSCPGRRTPRPWHSADAPGTASAWLATLCSWCPPVLLVCWWIWLADGDADDPGGDCRRGGQAAGQAALAEQPAAEQDTEQDADFAGRGDRADRGEAQRDEHEDVGKRR